MRYSISEYVSDDCQSLEIFKMELPTVKDSFAVSAEEAERITLILEKQFASRFTDHDKGQKKARDSIPNADSGRLKAANKIPGVILFISRIRKGYEEGSRRADSRRELGRKCWKKNSTSRQICAGLG